MDLTTLARAKTATGNTGGTTQDALLGVLVTSVSRRMEQQMNRHVHQVERTEVLALISGYRTLSLRGVPIDMTKTLTMLVSTTRDFTNADEYVVNEDFVLDETSGLINFLELPGTKVIGAGAVPLAPAFVKVTYTGGLAADTAGLISAYPDIADACDMQVAHRYRRRDSLGTLHQKVGGSAGESTHEEQYELLKEVREVCAYYRRTVFT